MPSITDKEFSDASVCIVPGNEWDTGKLFREQLNAFRNEIGIPMSPSSYYRTVRHEQLKGRSGKSEHTRGTACDFVDRDRRLTNYILKHPEILDKYDFYMESPLDATTWLHLGKEKKSKRIYRA